VHRTLALGLFLVGLADALTPLLLAILTVLFVAAPAYAQSGTQSPRSRQLEQLKQLSIEELIGTDVTSASRRIERLVDVPAAVAVITADDLRRMGAMTLPQALRLAGQLDVAQVSGPQYVIATRGFAISTANKMLVLIDGRTVYSPVFGGVFWETQDIVIHDVERIEVIRGPGGSIWGGNAVNGVINVITKRAADTRGTFVNVSAGTNMLGPYAVRHGGRLGDAGSYRAYAKVRFEDSHQLVSGADAQDDFDFGQAGFRLESGGNGPSQAFLQGDLYTGTMGLTGGGETNFAGGNLQARYTRTYGDHVSTAQAYYDRTYRRVPNQYRGVLNTVDVDLQHQWRAGRHNLVFGGGYRRFDGDDYNAGPGFFFDPRERTSHRANVFAQDEIHVGSRLFVTVGSKFERNEFTGFEVQPTVRARWSWPHRSVWGAVSRAVRVPTRFDTDLRIRVPNSPNLLLTGSPDFKSEEVVAYEAGYRRLFGDRLSIDVAAFVNRYDDLRTQEITPGHPVTLGNEMNGLSRGIGPTIAAQITPWWQVHASHAYLWKELTFDPTSTDPTHGAAEANDPRNIFKVRSYMAAGSRYEIDTFLRYYGARPQPAVEAYTELDARLGYRVKPGWDLSLIGLNLLHDRHVEFRAGTAPETYERSITLRSIWRF
jgi:iron complex outermembrane recepter protein